MNSIRRELHSRGMCSVCICELLALAIAAGRHSLERKVTGETGDQALP